MEKMRKSVLMLSLLMLLFSCGDDNQQRKERSIGGSGELLLVTQNEEQFNGRFGQAVKEFFEEPVYGLPQPEPAFHVAHVNKNGFSEMFQKHRNILGLEIIPNIEKPLVEIATDWRAAPQYFLNIKAASIDDALKIFEKRKEDLFEHFLLNEYERFQTYFRASSEKKMMSMLNEKFGISILIPEGYMVAVDADDFVWLRKETEYMSYGMLIYERPYTSESDIDTVQLVNARDSYLLRYIPGPTEGSYMTTDREFIVPHFRVLPDFPAGYAVEMRGLWKVDGDFMGGPYVAYTVVSPEHDRLITVEGFIYYPNKNKRDYMRQHESVIRTLKFIDKEN